MRQHGKAETNHRRPAKVPFDLRRTEPEPTEMSTPAIEASDDEPTGLDRTTTNTAPADDHSNQQLPKLPTRRTHNQSMAATLRLWHTRNYAFEYAADTVVIPHLDALEDSSPWCAITQVTDLVTGTRKYPKLPDPIPETGREL